jgi:hypothetical protein
VPTYERLERFLREYRRLSPEMREAFLEALADFIADVVSGQFRPSLRVKRVRSARGRLWEMSFARDGRATFEMMPADGGQGSCTSADTASATTRFWTTRSRATTSRHAPPKGSLRPA